MSSLKNDIGRYSVTTVTLNGTSEVTLTHPAVKSNSFIHLVPVTEDVAASAPYISVGPTDAGVVKFKATGTNDCVYNVFIM